MIYAQVDVELRDHERIFQAAADAPPELAGVIRSALLGLFTWSLLYCRAKKRNGDIPHHAARAALGGGQDEVIRRLLSIGLWTDDGACYRVRNYSVKNDSREDIEARIAATTARKAKYRERLRSEPPPSVGDAEGTRSARVPLGVGDHAHAHDLKIPEEIPSARARDGDRFPEPCPADLELSDEARAYAEMLPLADVDDVFAKFKRHYVSGEGAGRKAVDWLASKWQDWCAREQPIQRRERDRRREERERAPPPEVPHHTMSPAVKRAPVQATPPPADFLTALDKLGT